MSYHGETTVFALGSPVGGATENEHGHCCPEFWNTDQLNPLLRGVSENTQNSMADAVWHLLAAELVGLC